MLLTLSVQRYFVSRDMSHMIRALSRDKEAPHFQTAAFILLLEQHLMIVVSVRTIIFCFRRWEQGYRHIYIYIYIYGKTPPHVP